MNFLDQIYEGVKQNPLEENCGFVLKDDTVIFLENISESKIDSFKISEQDTLKYLGNIKYIFHNHVVNAKKPGLLDPRTPSVEDVNGQLATGVPWLILASTNEYVLEPLELPRTPNNDYLDRPFIWFINDCYTLIQDYYKFELGIELKDEKLYNPKEIRKSHSIFENFVEEYGFAEVDHLDDLENGDLFIVDNSGFNENHLMVYNNGKLLHQGLLSQEEPFERNQQFIRKRLRYVG